MTWLITEVAFDLVVGDGQPWLHGFTHRHEWLGYGEGLSDSDRLRIGALPLQWEIRRQGTGHVKKYLELDGGTAIEGATTAVRVTRDAIIVVAEIEEKNWESVLRGFEMYATAAAPKYLRLNVPFGGLSQSLAPSRALKEFIAGSVASATVEPVSAVFFFGAELPAEVPA